MVNVSKLYPKNLSGCRFCKKTFCCSECRNAHENKNHPDPKCMICHEKYQLFKVRNDTKSQSEDKLLWHIAFNHLPVCCKICGEVYKTNQEILSAKPCGGYKNHRKRETSRPVSGPALIEITEAFPVTTDSPGTPARMITKEAVNRSRIIASNKDRRQGSLDSPPGGEEIVRQTSTPMHGNSELAILTLKKQAKAALNKAGCTPFKGDVGDDDGLSMPSSLEFDTPNRDNSESECIEVTNEFVSPRPGKVITGLLPLKLNYLSSSKDSSDNSAREKSSKSGCSTWGTPIAILKKPTEKSILKYDLMGKMHNDSSAASNDTPSEKRVRFSDQHFSTPSKGDDSGKTGLDNSGNDVFFEAQESSTDLADDSKAKDKKVSNGSEAPDFDTNNNSSNNINKKYNHNHKNVNRDKNDECSPESNEELPSKEVPVKTEILKQEPEEEKKEQNEEKVKDEEIIKIQLEDMDENDKTNGGVDVETSKENKDVNNSTSRIVMMLLVEQTGDSTNLSELDLRPIIDSGLQHLENVSPVDKNKENNQGNNRRRRSSNSWSIFPESQMPTISKSHSFSDLHNLRVRRKLKPRQETVVPKHQDESGIFSAMARAVRTALNKLPGSLTTRNLAREPLSPPYVTRVSHTHSSSMSTTELVRSGSSSNQQKSPKMLKRRRSEEVIGAPCQDSPDNYNFQSPAPKRYRTGWCKIKAREPLPRMRNLELSENSNYSQNEKLNGQTKNKPHILVHQVPSINNSAKYGK